jgi:hypothetical protein
MFANFGAQQAAQTGRNISNAFRGVTDAIGTVTGADLRPADERAAGQAQALARSIDMKDPASIRAGADKMRQFNPKAAEALEGRATALEAKIATTAATAEQLAYDRKQQAIANADRALNTAVKMNDSQSEIAMRKAELELLEATTPDQIAKAKTDLENARAQVKLTEAQTESTKALTDTRREELKGMGSTDFLRELSAAGLDPAEEERLLRERLEARAATGGVSGYGEKLLETRLGQLVTYIEAGKEATKSLQTAENILSVMDDANIGAFSDTKAFANYWLGATGLSDSAVRATAANELIKVLTGEITLDAAGNLKGALSDKDLAFLQNTIPSKDMSAEGMRNIFTQMAAERSADVFVATELDNYLATATAKELGSTAINNKAEEYRVKAREAYLLTRKKAGLYTGPILLSKGVK